MCLNTKINLMKLYLLPLVILASAYYSHAAEEQSSRAIKTMIAREIMRKVSNITINSLAKVPDDKKIFVLRKIEKKLAKTAAALPDGDRYVQFIMDEFKNKAFTTTMHPEKHDFSTKRYHQIKAKKFLPEKLPEKMKIEVPIVEMQEVRRKIFDNETKERLISDIAHKIETVAKGYLRSSQTLEQKQKILEKIKAKILETSQRKHMQIHNQHNELKAYADLIAKGFELSMMKLLNTKKRRMGGDLSDTPLSNVKIAELEYQNITVKPDILDEINQYKIFFSEIWKDAFIDPRCDEITEEICLRLGSLHKLSCGDGQVISLLQLCDGVADCWNEGDETNCTDQALGKVRQAMSVMADIDETIPGKCLQTMPERDILSYHHQLLQTMLKNHFEYLEKNTPPNTQLTPVDHDFDIKFIKNSISDIRMAVSTLSYAFEANLCTPHDVHKTLNNTRRLMDDEVEAVKNTSEQQVKWSPKYCVCKHQFCKTDNCDPRCQRICYQKYTLNHWECHAISGDTTISLDFICDGKLDCYDESDEILCTTASYFTKYEANNMYKDLLDILSLKSLSMEYGQSRNKIASEVGVVRQLQKLTTKSEVDLHSIKALRDEYFKILVQIYVDFLQTSTIEEIEHTYDFLIMLNQKLVTALKLSHSGNVNHLTPAGCYCRNGTCAVVRCSKKCIATCQIEPIITQYWCNVDNTTVHIKAVCNGKKDCPNDEDEKNCSSDVCRSHHLLLLRHNLQTVGVTLKGTILGDTLDKWKAKVISSLMIVKGNARPNHKTIEDIIIKILRDLVTSYASVEEYRRLSTAFVIGEFRNVSDIVKQTLKSCGN